MKPAEHTVLAKEILADERLEDLRATSLAATLAAARQRRRRRAVKSRVAVSVAVTMTILVLFRWMSPSPSSLRLPEKRVSSVKIINDRELLDLFPDGSVALIGPAGKQRLIFLEAAAAAPISIENR